MRRLSLKKTEWRERVTSANMGPVEQDKVSIKLSCMIRGPRFVENLVNNFFEQKAESFLWTDKLPCEIKRTTNITYFYIFLHIRNWVFWVMIFF